MNERNTPIPGPSDSSDSGSDLIGSTAITDGQFDLAADLEEVDGNPGIDDTTDRSGTGERMSAGTEAVQDAADIGFDRVVTAAEAGLGGGLDQAEEAQLGVTDEQLAELEEKTTDKSLASGFG